VSALDDLKWVPKIVSSNCKEHRLKLERFVRFRLGHHAPNNGSCWYTSAAESGAAFCRFDVSLCLVHDGLAGIEKLRLRASRDLAT
jgi:hypothetical protein